MPNYVNDILEFINQKPRQSSMFILSLAIILWSISMLFSKLEIGYFGLISGINPLFFVSIGLITVSFLITIKRNLKDTKLLVLHLTLLIFFMALIPILIEGTPRFPYNFASTRSIDYILQFGHSNADVISYQSWPGVFYFGSILSAITDIAPLNLILVIPLILLVINAFLYYLIYSTFLKRKEVWIAFLLSNVLFFSAPYYFLPGVLGTLMILFALMVFLRFEFIQSRMSPGLSLAFIIFSAAAVVSHFLSSMYLFMALVFFFILSLIYKKDTRKLFILVLVLIAAFQIYIAGSYAISTLAGSINEAFHLENLASETAAMGFSGSEQHSQIVYVRIISALMLVGLAGLELIYEFLIKRRWTLKNLTLPTWIASNVSLTLLTAYSGEIVNRTFSLSSSIFYMLASKTINNKYLSIILIFVLLVAPVFSVINSYGNDQVDYVSPAELYGSKFLFDHSVNQSVVFSLNLRTWEAYYSSNLKYIPVFYGNKTPINWNNFTTDNQKKEFKEFYISINEMDINSFIFLSGQFDLKGFESISESSTYNKIYSNEGFVLYYLRK